MSISSSSVLHSHHVVNGNTTTTTNNNNNNNNGWHKSGRTEAKRVAATSLNGNGVEQAEPEMDETAYFEQNRIRQLKDERIHIQKKTFTKWCNSYLNRARLEINDLFTDFADGILLMKFLEIISGEKLGKPNRGRMRVQKVENLNRCLDFLKYKRIQLENIGAEDITDGNERLILGLIWTIILRFTIENIEIEAKESGERKHAKEALLLWCQRKTMGYPNVKVDNFTSSWRNGLAFCALIHAHRPELVDFDAINPQEALANLNSAFDVAERNLDIARLLDAEDVNVSHPDEKSIITYVSLFYHYFAKQKSELTGARRVAKVVGELVGQDSMQDDYEQLASELLRWVQITIGWLSARNFPNTLRELRDELATFNRFRKEEKPPKYHEKGELEALFFALQTKRKASRRRTYVPAEGLLLQDVESAWNELEKAEHGRQGALIAELQRQERLELRAQLFHKKADVRNAWLREISAVLAQFECAPNGQSVAAGRRLLKNIETEAAPKKERFEMIRELSAELQSEQFHASEEIRVRERDIVGRWNTFLALLAQRETELCRLEELAKLLERVAELDEELGVLGGQLKGRELGKHMADVDELLKGQELIETDIGAKGECLRTLRREATSYARQNRGEQTDVLQKGVDTVQRQFDLLVAEARARRDALQLAKEFFQFVQHFDEQTGWMDEQLNACDTVLQQRDLSALKEVQRLHKGLEAEMQSRWERTKRLINRVEELCVGAERIGQAFPDGERLGAPQEVQWRVDALQRQWEQLRERCAALQGWLVEAERLSQYFQDANEAESWMREKMPLALSEDFGRDISTAECLCVRHRQLEKEIGAYRAEIGRLEELAQSMADTDFTLGTEEAPAEQEVVVPKAVVLYPYSGKGIAVQGGEELALLDDSNRDWWRVLTRTGVEGYVPANYCELTFGETVTVAQPLSSFKPRAASLDGPSALSKRQLALSADYRRLCHSAERRGRSLEEALKLFKFFGECCDFEQWANGVCNVLQEPVVLEHLAALQHKFQMVRDEVRGQGAVQLIRLNTAAEELQQEELSRADAVRSAQTAMSQLWTRVQKLVEHKALSLEAAARLAQFQEECADTKEWLAEKWTLVQCPQPDQGDLRALQAAQRLFQNLERDLRPLADRMEALKKSAAAIAKEQQDKANDVHAKVAELDDMYQRVLARAKKRIGEAEQSQGREMFERTAKELLEWTAKMRDSILLEPLSENVPAEEVLRRHAETRDQMTANEYEFAYVDELGRRLMAKGPAKGVQEKLAELQSAKRTLENEWTNREAECRQLLEWQAFTREAERIEALSRGHSAFLDLGAGADSVEGVQSLLKTHAQFEARLAAQEERLFAFVASADRLIGCGHANANRIEVQRTEVLQGHKLVHQRTKQRRSELERGLAFEGMRRDAAELASWMADKKRALEGAERQGQRAITRHQAFVAELVANRAELARLRGQGQEMLQRGIADGPRLDAVLGPVERNWTELEQLAERKGELLEQANSGKALEEAISEVNARLEECELRLGTGERGRDLRSVKKLMQRKALVDKDVQLLEQRLRDISDSAAQMRDRGHFAVTTLMAQVDALVTRFDLLQGPLEQRRVELEESLKWHQLAFDADVELQWIGEKMHLAESRTVGRSLTESQNLAKRHEQLVSELECHHAHRVDSLTSAGRGLVRTGHICSAEINAKCAVLETAWTQLVSAVEQRGTLLAWALAREQFLYDVAEAESWLGEKRRHLEARSAHDEGRLGAEKLQAWTRALQHDLEPYREMLKELCGRCEQLASEAMGKSADGKELASRMARVQTQAKALETASREAGGTAGAHIALCDYLEESADMEQWLESQLTAASSEEYGADLDQWATHAAQFDEFRQHSQVGLERMAQLEGQAAELAQATPEWAEDLAQRGHVLRALCAELGQRTEQRAQRLAKAEKEHRLRREAEMLAERVAEKALAMPADTGRDAKQAYALILNHEVFENEVAQLHTQLETLLGEQLSSGESLLLSLADSWRTLREASMARGAKLLASYETHKFVAQVRDLLGWTQNALAEMGVGDAMKSVRDLQTAEWLAEEHRRLRAELDGREVERVELTRTGTELAVVGHCATEEVDQRLAQLHRAFEEVRQHWDSRAQWLDQMVQWHALQREASQLLSQITVRDRALDALEQRAAENAEERQRELVTFMRAMDPLLERVERMGELGAEMVARDHREAKSIQQLVKQVKQALDALGAHANGVKRALDGAEALAQFEAELGEMLDWVGDKERRLETHVGSVEGCSLEEKLDRLKWQQALQSELAANGPRMEALREQAQQLRVWLGADAERVLHSFEQVNRRWSQLNTLARKLDAAMAEARELLELEQLADRICTFVRAKEALVNAEESGEDLEHCQTLLSRLDEDQSVDEATLAHTNRLGSALLNKGSAEAGHVRKRLDELNEGWRRLGGRLAAYRQLLSAALEVHRFNRDVDETNERIGEKAALLGSEETGKDLAGVERLLRAQDAVERDMSAIHRKLNEHDEHAKALLARELPLRETVLHSLRKLELSWEGLAQLAHSRRQSLQRAHSIHRFFDAVRRLEQWATGLRAKMSGGAQTRPRSLEEAERALQLHQERHAEMGAREEELRALREFGHRLQGEQPEHKADVQRAQRRLQSAEHQTKQCWEQEQAALQRALHTQKLLQKARDTLAWVAHKEAQLDGLEPGDTVEQAETALKELAHFAQTLSAQCDERLVQLAEAEHELTEMTGDAEAQPVLERVLEAKERSCGLKERTEAKGRLLTGALRVGLFLRECTELITWMNAKLQLAYDDAFLDVTNLRSKLQKHLAFDAELRANEWKVEQLSERGEKIVCEEAQFDEGGRAKAQLHEVVAGWTELVQKSEEKALRLRTASEAHHLGKKMAELEKWLDAVEAQIGSEDHGRGVASAEALLAAFCALREDIQAKAVPMTELLQRVAQLGREELSEQAQTLTRRWEALVEPCQIRETNLQDALRCFRWADEADEHLEWLRAKVRALESTEYGRSLHAAQSLLQKHQILEQEFSIREPGIAELVAQGAEMLGMESSPETRGELAQRVAELQERCTLFRALAAVRLQRLTESQQLQEFYAEAAEAEHWMRERLPLLAEQQQQPDSSHAAERQLRRVGTLEQEIDTFAEQLRRLAEKSEQMARADHFDSAAVLAKHGQLQELFIQLSGQCKHTKAQIGDSIRYFQFVHKADELLSWLRERLALAEREDYGSDLDECESLIEQFEQVVRELSGAGERVAVVQRQKEELLRSRHANAGSIRAKGQDVGSLWREVNEAANERQQALLDGKNIHMFDQRADELLERLAEKEAHLVAMGDEQLAGIEPKEVKAQCQRHADFTHSLRVLEAQVDELCAEADRIVQAFPRTADHLEVRRGELVEQLKDVRDGAARLSERLAQAQGNHAYFQEFRDLMMWTRKIYATITGELLPREPAGCEALLTRHAEYRREMDAKATTKAKFVQRGNQMVAAGNALSAEIQAKIDMLEAVFAQLAITWTRRQQVYEENADVQRWLAMAAELERWLAEREQFLREDWRSVADGVEGVEHQIRHFDDFLATLDAQSPNFEALKRTTRLEEAFERMRGEEKDREQRERGESAAGSRRETQQIRTLEKKKILAEKRQERERRKTQEISLLSRGKELGQQQPNTATILVAGPEPSFAAMPCATLPRVRARASSDQPPSASANRLSIEIVHHSERNNEQQQLQLPTAVDRSTRAPSVGRTPGFTTRRTQSIRRSRHWDDLRSIDMHGYLDRKHELQSGGKRATFRSWKSHYTILCGQLLCFFKDEQHFLENAAAAAPLPIHGSQCTLCPEYVKKRNVFRLNTADGAEYLFAAEGNQRQMLDWVERINFRAQLAPADQLLSFSTTRPTASEPLTSGANRSQPCATSIGRSQTLELRSPRDRMRAAEGHRSATMDPRRRGSGGVVDCSDEYASRVQVGGEEDDCWPPANGNGTAPNGHQQSDAESVKSVGKRRSAFSFLKRSSATRRASEKE